MLELLQCVFAGVCGQNPEHTWAPGGVLLPCCQRCLGLYAGASAAAWLHLVVRPRLTARFLQVHGMFMLLMLPLGFHWVAHGALVRTEAGILFGFGLVTFLRVTLATQTPRHDTTGQYAVGLLLTLVTIPTLAVCGGPAAALMLSTSAAAGVFVLAALVLANAGRAMAWLARRLNRRKAASPV